VNALVYVVPDDAGGPVSEGPLNGMTVAVKDNICTKNMPTTCSSVMLKGKPRPFRSSARCITKKTLPDFQSPFDATVVDLLTTSGATIIGKTNCDEFGMGYGSLDALLLHLALTFHCPTPKGL
jgi:aspartyl-tRNA(Asn)/glutamyl-tRNA(Gln) amidotransferase subunit A